jgi:hypothetical protein
MFCLLRNAQMTLHGMVKHHGAWRIHFVFPAQATWETDVWGLAIGDRAPMVLLTTLFARRADDAQAYDEVVVPFLDRMIMEVPVAGDPRDPHPRIGAFAAAA